MEADNDEVKKSEFSIVVPQPKDSFEDHYSVLEVLGRGRFGIVRKITDKTGNMLAAKFIRTIKAKDRQQVLDEIKIMNLLRHPKLLKLIGAFEGPKEMIMVTEYISGGELFERVVADDFTLTEKDSILFVRQICEAVAYMHEKNFVHMDLKPENIMCQSRSCHQIKVIDFGLTQILDPNTPIRVLFGTPEFIAPEIISFEPIGTESDMWSIGVICYVLLTGLSPFMGDNDAETFANITRAEYEFDDKICQTISPEAIDFINLLLIKKKELRMSSKDCLIHPWLSQRDENMSEVVLPTDELKKFIIRRKWQKTGNAIRALGRMATLSAKNKSDTSTTMELSSDSFKEEEINEELNDPESTLSTNMLVEQSNIGGQNEKLPEECKQSIDIAVPTIIDQAIVIDDNNTADIIIPECEKHQEINANDKILIHETSVNNKDIEIEPTVEEYTSCVQTTEQLNITNEETSEYDATNDQKTTPLADSALLSSLNINSPINNKNSKFPSEANDLELGEADDSRNEMTRTKSQMNSPILHVHPGSVSSTVKIFEQVNQSSNSDQSASHRHRFHTPVTDMQLHNGRIRKAFEFWNK